MKRNYIASFLIVGFLGMAIQSCKPKKSADLTIENKATLPQEKKTAHFPVVKATKGSKIYTLEVPGRVVNDTRNQVQLASRVTGRIEKLYIKYNFQPVKKGQLVMEIYSPDLATAQRELLLIQSSGNQEGMLEPAKQRLMNLGMTATQVSRILRTGQISYRVPVFSHADGYILEQQAATAAASPTAATTNAGGAGMDNMGAGNSTNKPVNQTAANPASSPILLREGQYVSAGQSIFTIYKAGNLVVEFSLLPSVVAQLNKETSVIIQRTADQEKTLRGKIGMLQPVVNAGENFVIARVYLQNSGLQAGELVSGQFPFVASKGYWLPKSAVVSIGNQDVAFKKQGKTFIPITLKTGVKLAQEVQVFTEIENAEFAKNAAYLVDSESFIQTVKTKTD
ncbi:efflux RND transporter periplasmic adaptor subunit [Pedobacter sp.]|uniref:efflux RND transporter periplasmic adaptor subunit n=1 Tax=Pedobacter sp. TaxID=1411316 RepID=UPI003D7FD182